MKRRFGYPAAAGLALCVLAVCLLVAGLQPRTVAGTASASAPPFSPASGPPPSTALPKPTQAQLPPAKNSTCDATAAGLDIRHQVAQLVVVGVSGADPAAVVSLVRDNQVGSIFIGGNATQLLQNHALDAVQKAATLPVAVAVDEEGGRVQRIDALDGDLPSARALAASKTTDEVRALAAQRGRQLRARGVTVDFAPDADVTDRPDDDVIGDRSFSPDPARARSYALAFASGLLDAGVMPVLKHFPGHGHASGDSHQGLVRTPPLDQLRKVDLVPYQHIADFGASGVMVGHLDVPGLTNGVPASLAAPAYQLLRGEYGFTGPVITDDLGAMKAITAEYSLPEAVLKALQAGADEALWSSGGQVGEVLDRLTAAVSSGELPRTRVQESVARVLHAKGLCG